MDDSNQAHHDGQSADSNAANRTAHVAGAPVSTARRQALFLGAAGVAAAVTVRPAFAQTAASVITCEIPVPDPARAGQYIAADGTLVPRGTPGAFPPALRPLKGQDVKNALAGRSLPGTSYEQGQAYLNYIRRLRAGQSGFTCFASIQMPR